MIKIGTHVRIRKNPHGVAESFVNYQGKVVGIEENTAPYKYRVQFDPGFDKDVMSAKFTEEELLKIA